MKRMIAIYLIASLSACASMNGKDSSLGGSKMTSGKEPSSSYDEKYIARVNRAASQHGVIVTWINPPRARREKKTDNN
jgi:hypothetical protein